jgi:hypothetical protein
MGMQLTKEKAAQSRPFLTFPLAAELSLYPKYLCPKCGLKLWAIKSEKTKWREILETQDGRKHLKRRCNLYES